MQDDELEALAAASEGQFKRRTRSMEDFRYDEQQEKYWDTTTGVLLAAKSVDGAIPVDLWPTKLGSGKNPEPKPFSPAAAINNVDTGLTVEGSTWWPGEPRIIQDLIVTERGAQPMQGASCYNSYIAPPRSNHDSPTGVDQQPWIDHVKLMYPDPVEHEHFFNFCAHMIQRPDEKINHGVVLSGPQGIGKDTAMLPLRRGVGEWNAAEVGPDAVTSQYNGHVKSVLLVINEVRPQDDDYKASNFYNLLKPLLAAPPEMLPMTVKYANTIYVRNLCHVILTTNDPLSMYIPEEDRRLFVMDSPLQDPRNHATFPPNYFEQLHGYLVSGGADSTVKWLNERSLENFDAACPPPITRARRLIVQSANLIRRTAADDIFDFYLEEECGGKMPDFFFHKDLTDFARRSELFDDAEKVLRSLNAKNFHFKMAERGFDLVRNPLANEWRAGKFRSRAAFAAKSLTKEQQIKAIREGLESRELIKKN